MSIEEKPKVLLTGLKLDFYVKKYWKKLLERTQCYEAKEPSQLIKEVKKAQIIIVVWADISKEVVYAAENLKGIVKWGAGLENIDIKAATEKRVIVSRSPGGSISVAEAAILLLLIVAKNYIKLNKFAKRGQRVFHACRGIELEGKTIGIVGMGDIGSKVAKKARCLGMRVLGYDPYISQDSAKQMGISLVDLEKLLREADAVSLHCPLASETYHLIGEKELKLMKKNAILINTSRGAVVDEHALVEALKKKQIAGAGLDVFEEEPIKPDNPLLHMENVAATPHRLGATWEGLERTTLAIQEAVLDILEGKVPKYIVNPEVLDKTLRTNK